MRYKRAGDIRVCVCVFRMCGEADDSPKGTFSMDVYICICTFIYVYIFSMYATRAAKGRRTRGAGCAGARMTLSRCCCATDEMRIRV